jgi:hypothetical protein
VPSTASTTAPGSSRSCTRASTSSENDLRKDIQQYLGVRTAA